MKTTDLAWKIGSAMLFGAMTLVSCTSNDPSATGAVSLKMEAASSTGGTITGRTISGRTAATTVITDVKISLREVEFEIDQEDPRHETDSIYNEDVKLQGPFIVDLYESAAFVEQLVTTVNIPNGNYEEVEFKLHKNTEAGEMNGKSILIKGTIDGTPFVFWHDTDEEFEIDFASAATDISINGTPASLVITLQLEKLFSTVKGGVNLSQATDGDGDGVIEINPGSVDNDGNKDIADAIKNLFEEATDLIDDED
jgi:hypothetical protein